MKQLGRFMNRQYSRLDRNKYEQRKENCGSESLRTLDEKNSLKLILKLTADNPATIVIDALDECDP